MINKVICKVLIVIITILTSLNIVFADDNVKLSYWDVQRKGTNYFNEVPKEKWFSDAHKLGVQYVRLAFDKWKGANGLFLIGNVSNYKELNQQDAKELLQVLSWAKKYDVKIVVAPLSLPYLKWIQGREKDTRMWDDKKYWQSAIKYWVDLATLLKDKEIIYGYNIINEPIPERGTGIAEEALPDEYKEWYKKYAHTSHDIVEFYNETIKAIRTVDPKTSIILDAGWYARPDAFTYWTKFNDTSIIYAFHMYEPYSYTSPKNYNGHKNLTYPGNATYNGTTEYWDKNRIQSYFSGFYNWTKEQGIPANRIMAEEFGCYRRNPNCAGYLTDLIDIFNTNGYHWSFYSYREDWDGYDYEVGTGGLTEKFWKDQEKGLNPEPPRNPNNPLFKVISKEFKPNN